MDFTCWAWLSSLHLLKFCDPLEIEIPEYTLDRAVIVKIKLLLIIIITATKTTVSIFP